MSFIFVYVVYSGEEAFDGTVQFETGKGARLCIAHMQDREQLINQHPIELRILSAEEEAFAKFQSATDREQLINQHPIDLRDREQLINEHPIELRILSAEEEASAWERPFPCPAQPSAAQPR
ncbi:hypothetical protein T484DRAFT_1837317 [Baffinella frigidus]|nr:hypothetical protein T484DRAFT_1837317 [Cryptophyta sp. CCMP2293]